MGTSISVKDARTFRIRAQQLDLRSGTIEATSVLDAGVQDTGPDGGPWALAIRGIDDSRARAEELVTVWSLRGAPHIYRRSDLPRIAAAVQPLSEADACRRIFDAAKPLKAAGIGCIEALDTIAARMQSIVTKPMVKGEVSTQLTAVMEPPYLRSCRPCNATHLYEMTFRLAALRAGLELQPGTSPPVLQPIPRFKRAKSTPQRYDVIRCYLRLLGPATPKHVAGFLDAPVRDVQARWPSDTVEVSVEGQTRFVLAVDEERLTSGADDVTRLLGPFDLFLQARDRALLVADAAHAKALWPVLGRPGAVLARGDIVGTWRPRQTGKQLRIQVEFWQRLTSSTHRAVSEQAERLARHRGVRLSGVDFQ